MIWYVIMLIRFIKYLFWRGSHKTLSSAQWRQFMSHLQKTKKLQMHQQIIEYDKIYHHILKKLWYEGTFWEILKQSPQEIKNIQEIWELHKFRNTLVHDLRDLDERFIKKQSLKYSLITEKFIQQVIL